MKKRKNTFAKVMAGVALLAIVLGIIGTGVLVIVSSMGQSNNEISQEELQEYLESLTGATVVSGSGGEVQE